MTSKTIDRLVAAFVFLWALVLYGMTVSPTASFWDSGEFIAIANRLEVSHPPGAPFYMLIGRFFSMFVPTAYVALSVNLVSVLCSALTILLAHLIIVRLVRQWQGPPSGWTFAERVAALGGGVIGALTFAATDSFWFNAVEAEVYAMSMFFTAAVVWLVMVWSEQASREEAVLAGGQHPFGLSANRYLVLIAYLFGLAIGVHLLNLLAVFFIALIVFFTEFDRSDWTPAKRWIGIAAAGLVSCIVFLAIYPGVVQWLPSLAEAAPVLVLVGLVALVVLAVWYTQKQGYQALNLIALCVTVVLIGYSTYALIFIRSASDPPIDENDPETTEAIVSYLKREQYGETPLAKGNTYDNRLGRVDQSRTVSFPRRHSPDPSHGRIYAQYNSDWDFFWEYQIGHMYLRYFMWNFVGKASDTQDAPWISGIFERTGDEVVLQTPSERSTRNAYYGLPLLLGVFGMLFHFMRDWKRAFSVLIFFLVTGVGIIIYLNQPPLQPRERDYSYVASFFAFAFWVGLGGTGLIQMVAEALRDRLKPALQKVALLGLFAVTFAAVPLLVTVENYYDHDRSGNYVAPEYAYNMLMSVADDAIIFTNGDNDTFPLWYLQEVEGVRQDVRVVNLSLLNTPWYVRQLKSQASRASEPLPISISDEQINRLAPVAWEPREVALPVQFDTTLGDGALPVPASSMSRMESPMRWQWNGRPYSQNLNILYAADQVAFDILQTNAREGWKRPVYFAVTVSPDGQLDLQNYFQLEGQAYRVVPIRHNEALGRIEPAVSAARLKEFKFTNLDDPNVYYDENIRRMVDNYRNIFAHTAQQLALQGERDEALAVLDRIMTEVPFSVIPGDERSYLFIAQAYESAGAVDKALSIWKQAEPLVLYRISNAQSEREAQMAAQFVQMIRFAYMDAGDFDAAADFGQRVATAIDDPSLRLSADELRVRYGEAVRNAVSGSDTLAP